MAGAVEYSVGKSADEFELVAVHPDQVPHCADALKLYIEEALTHAHDETDAAQLLHLAEKGKAVVLAVVLKDVKADFTTGEKEAAAAVGVVQLGEREVDGVTMRCLHVSTLAGGKLMEWLDSVWLPALHELAREQGAQFLSCSGRRGWKRLLEPRGWMVWRESADRITMVGRVNELQQERAGERDGRGCVGRSGAVSTESLPQSGRPNGPANRADL